MQLIKMTRLEFAPSATWHNSYANVKINSRPSSTSAQEKLLHSTGIWNHCQWYCTAGSRNRSCFTKCQTLYTNPRYQCNHQCYQAIALKVNRTLLKRQTLLTTTNFFHDHTLFTTTVLYRTVLHDQTLFTLFTTTGYIELFSMFKHFCYRLYVSMLSRRLAPPC